MDEDGEIFEIDPDENQQSDFSMSSYDGDNGDSLDIKPPQAQIGSVKEKREKRDRRERHHRHKSDMSHRHKSDKHRSRSDHRGSGERHSREKKHHREREDRSESGHRHRDRGGDGGRSSSSHIEAVEGAVSGSKARDKERQSRSGKRESKEHRRGRERSSNSQQQQQLLHMDHENEDNSLGDYYNNAPMHHDGGRLGPPTGGIPPLMADPALPPHHHSYHHHHQYSAPMQHQQQHHRNSASQHHVHHRSRGGHATGQQPGNQLNMSPRELTEREKRMERMMAAEKQKEQSQREAENRRQRKEEEKRVDPLEYQHHSYQQAGAQGAYPVGGRQQQQQQQHPYSRGNSYQRGNLSTLLPGSVAGGGAVSEASNVASGGGTAAPDSPQMSPPVLASTPPHQQPHHRQHKRKRHRKDPPEADEVQVISENEDADNGAGTVEKPSDDMVAQKDNADEAAADVDQVVDKDKEDGSDMSETGSSDSSSDSDSDSDSTDSEDEDGEKMKKVKKEDENDDDVNGGKTRSRSCTPDKEGRFDDSPRSEILSEVSPASGEIEPSPTRSPVPMKEQLPSYFPAIMGCRSVDEFECLNRIAEGTYGVVYRAREKCSNTIVALKRLKMEKEKEGFPITSLREINTLLKGQHCNIVTVREIVVGSNMDKIYIVMDYVEHDLKSLMETMNKKKQIFSLGEVKTLMLQLLRAVHHLHDNWILHRDLKTSNLLLSHTGILKVGDFGLAREYGSPLKQYTPIVVTLWYRAPELLLGIKYYSTAIDVWSVGCIFGELLAMEPMFPGKSEIDELNRIFKELGTPSDAIWPGYSQLPVVKRTQFTEFPYNHLRERFKERLSDKGFLLINKFLTYDPHKRITCQEALQHDYFHTEPPTPVPPAMFPTWPAKSENPNGVSSTQDEPNRPPKPPSGGKNFKDLGDDDHGLAGFFLGGGQQAGPGFQLKF